MHAGSPAFQVPKYAGIEIERRWLVAPEAVSPSMSERTRRIEDRYIQGTRLRLRAVHEEGKAPVYKLGKKYESRDPGSQAVVTAYLSEAEYEALSCLAARVSIKKRLSVGGGSLDVYEAPALGFHVFEVEFESLAQAHGFLPPGFVGREVTGDPEYTGFALAGGAA